MTNQAIIKGAMTKGLEGLIRLRRWRLDEKRQTVAELERLAARLRHELSDLDGYPADAQTARRARLRLSLTEVEDRLRGALSDVAQAMREIKKYDLLKARREGAIQDRTRQRRHAGNDSLATRVRSGGGEN